MANEILSYLQKQPKTARFWKKKGRPECCIFLIYNLIKNLLCKIPTYYTFNFKIIESGTVTDYATRNLLKCILNQSIDHIFCLA